MALYPLVKYPAPGLFKKTDDIRDFNRKLRLLSQDMIETMYHERGVGLAANQIGLSQSIFVASHDGRRGSELVLVNPVIIKASGSERDQEGCLSVPGHYENVRRYKKVTIRGLNLDGKAAEIEATGLLARIFQHETDHLNGRLFIHRLNILKRKRMFTKLDREFGSRQELA